MTWSRLWNTNPVSSNRQWMCRVHVPLPIVARLSVSKDLHLEVPHHGVHHFPTRRKQKDCKRKNTQKQKGIMQYNTTVKQKASFSAQTLQAQLIYLLTLRGRFSGLMSIS